MPVKNDSAQLLLYKIDISIFTPKSVDVLITHGTILTMDSERHVVSDSSVAIHGSKIVAVGNTDEICKLYLPRNTLDAYGMIIMPGLINTHTHGGDSLFRGLIENDSLERWLQRLWAVGTRFQDQECIYWGSALAYVEMVHAGITTAVDMFWDPEIMAQAAQKIGIRLITVPIYFDQANISTYEQKARLLRARNFIQAYQNYELIHPCIMPHSVYTVSPAHLQEAGEIANEFGVWFCIHASETANEVINYQKKFGLTPIQHLDHLGLLGSRTLLAHCVYVQADEFDLLSRRGFVVSHCPVSNLKLASVFARIDQMTRAGVKITLGTDVPISGNDLNLWMTLRLASILS